jgi:Predicted SAM-dependent methyltransferases
MYTITIFEGKEKQLIKHHPWVFSGAVESVSPAYKEPDWAKVVDSEGRFIAYGHYDEKSHIILRLFSWDEETVPSDEFLEKLIEKAIYRRRDFFILNDTTCFRLLHADADFFPGLTLDVYGSEIRGIVSSRFAASQLNLVSSVLEKRLHPSLITYTTDSFYGPAEGLPNKVWYYKNGGQVKEIEKKNTLFTENGIYFETEPGNSQKSGFYCDQRDNRKAVAKYARDKKVLDAFCYTGSFTLNCLRAGAESVLALDASESALRHLLYQVHLNENKLVLPAGSREKVTTNKCDIFDYMREIEDNCFDLMILDPPKLAQTKGKLENALKAYKDLNLQAMKKIRNGGIIATFSCSGALTREQFKTTLAWAAADIGAEIQILETLSAGADHPVRLSEPESEYLKGFILRVIR